MKYEKSGFEPSINQGGFISPPLELPHYECVFTGIVGHDVFQGLFVAGRTAQAGQVCQFRRGFYGDGSALIKTPIASVLDAKISYHAHLLMSS